MIKKVKTLNWDELSSSHKEDYVCIEENYDLYINDKFIEKMTSSPKDLKELGAGYVISEGYLEPGDIKDVHIDNDKIIVITNESKMSKSKKNDDKNNKNNNNDKNGSNSMNNIKVPLKTIFKIMEYMSNITGVWKITGGTHWACLFDLNGKEIITIEDIGRHNAVDKVIGYGVLNNINLDDKILVSSGRQPYVMVKKAVNAKIPAIISKSPSTDKGVELAKNNDIVLIGFARKNRFVVYNGFERIIDEDK
ncbi:formate dehydrogenase accessory sulfurtransferase FdhD [Methanothermococcus sp.]|uniref:formate dehydrogenase accessory sulfurtransferase FdhD n=1 Tax=Methanothermococcus sp. TaxID=2614238 RepID=UPI0025FDB9FA|nr:formate dehydrogenase accessory sulfurtransferase FdhD [Methanothermococcus sp.]